MRSLLGLESLPIALRGQMKKVERECSRSGGSGWRCCFGERMMADQRASSLELFRTCREVAPVAARRLWSLPTAFENIGQKATIEKASDATLHPRYRPIHRHQWQTHHLLRGRY